MDKPREVPIHQAPNRANLVLGCERELILSAGMLCAMLVFAIQTWWSVALGVCAWLVAVAVLSRMGKNDPIMSKVYSRHIRYAPFYPAHARPWTEAPEANKKWIN